MLKIQAELLENIRTFFKQAHILEVQTPLLRTTVAMEPSIDPIEIPQKGFLQTSPELAMKQLLAKGSGSIYQICKAFRDNEKGALHSLEFTMLEWYCVGFNHHDLMQQVDALLQTVLNSKPAEKISYQDLFLEFLKCDPHTLTLKEGFRILAENKIALSQGALENLTVSGILEILFSQKIEKKIGHTRPIFVFDYPVEQAALAKIRQGNPSVAERFELYYKGIELANGFHELNEAKEQKTRFLADNLKREKQGKKKLPLDEAFLNCLDNLPNCSGVALGIDRLLMLKMGRESIFEIFLQ